MLKGKQEEMGPAGLNTEQIKVFLEEGRWPDTPV